MSDLHSPSPATPIQAPHTDQPRPCSALLAQVAADHDHIEQSIANLRAHTGHAARLLEDLGLILADHYRFVAEAKPPQWILDATSAVTVEEDCAEVATIFQHAQAFNPTSTSATRAVNELVVAIRWHIDAEEATLYAEEATLHAEEAARSAEEATPSSLAS